MASISTLVHADQQQNKPQNYAGLPKRVINRSEVLTESKNLITNNPRWFVPHYFA